MSEGGVVGVAVAARSVYGLRVLSAAMPPGDADAAAVTLGRIVAGHAREVLAKAASGSLGTPAAAVAAPMTAITVASTRGVLITAALGLAGFASSKQEVALTAGVRLKRGLSDAELAALFVKRIVEVYRATVYRAVARLAQWSRGPVAAAVRIVDLDRGARMLRLVYASRDGLCTSYSSDGSVAAICPSSCKGVCHGPSVAVVDASRKLLRFLSLEDFRVALAKI
ncbi:MAG: hypothetical protein ABWW70_00365 [Thermoproteota archaeon]